MIFKDQFKLLISVVVFKDETSVTLDQKQNQVEKQQRGKVESYHEAGCVGGREAP